MPLSHFADPRHSFPEIFRKPIGCCRSTVLRFCIQAFSFSFPKLPPAVFWTNFLSQIVKRRGFGIRDTAVRGRSDPVIHLLHNAGQLGKLHGRFQFNPFSTILSERRGDELTIQMLLTPCRTEAPRRQLLLPFSDYLTRNTLFLHSVSVQLLQP